MDNSITQTQPTVKDFWQKLAQVVTAQRVAWAIIIFGIALRATLYVYKTALYVDEGALSLNLINRSFAGLLQPLDSEQAAPVGFLFIEKLALLAFGESEYALRLFPFLFSLVALYLFYEVARRCFQSWTGNTA